MRDAPLNVNQRAAAVRALCTLSEQAPPAQNISGAAHAVTEAKAAGKLVVLDAYGRLVEPNIAVRHAMGGSDGGVFVCQCVLYACFVCGCVRKRCADHQTV